MDSLQQKAAYLDKNSAAIAAFDIHSPEIASLLVYPHFNKEEHARRLQELDGLGVSSVMLGGRTMISGKKIAGKGCVGLVMMARAGNDKLYALKARRIDADRKTMEQEAELHRLANQAGVGPELIGFSKNFIVMEFVHGASIIDWVSQDGITADQTCRVALSVLEQCFSLDKIGLDHGELSSLEHHVITSGKTSTIVDFESASTKRKTCNVTAATQSLFLYGSVSAKVGKVIDKNLDREKILSLLKIYKREQTRTNFDKLVDVLTG